MATDTAIRRSNKMAETPGTRHWIAQAKSFFERYARELFRNKTVLFWSIAFPVGFYLLTITVFVPVEEIPANERPYIFAATAISYGTFGAIIVCLSSFGQQLAADLEADRYKQFRALPIAPTADMAGRMLAGLLLATVSFLAVVVVSLGTGASYTLRSIASVPIAMLAFVGFAVIWMVLAMAVASAITDERYAALLTVAVALLAYMLTGYNGTDPGSYTGPDVLLNYLPNTLPSRVLVYQFVDAPASSLAPPALPSTIWSVGTLTLYTALALGVGIVVVRTRIYGTGVLA
ncbi:ABC transporter permease [Halapricum salinum]|uniref:ABC transporter permease n=2 Tax=Halapricum salinum TaxID=1457250 RepID=A0A4D6HHK6_9EURY|nr:ABC transporter permease [Halapricum salinum]